MFRYVFALFLLLFFRYAQYDVLAYIMSSMVGHYMKPWPWTVAIVLTLLLVLVGHGTELVLKKRTIHHRLPYVVVGWGAAAITSAPFVSIYYQIGLLIVAVAVAGVMMWTDKFSQRSFSQKTYVALLQLILLCLFVGVGNGVTDLTHYELRTAQALQSDHPKGAYKVGEKSYTTSPRLFAMRCYLMATIHKHGLGNKVFEQMVPAGGGASCLLLPNDEEQRLLFPISNQEHLLGSARHVNETPLQYFKRCAWLAAFKGHRANNVAIDYYLSALLLERRLDLFAQEIDRFYSREVQQGKLPTYFAQALVLYQRSRTQPIVRYQDSGIEANFEDFSDMGDTISNRTIRCNTLRNSYGETYWWWYTYGI